MPPIDPFAGAVIVLVVDDDPAIRRSVRKMLEWAGYIVYEAAGAGEALALLEVHGPRISLLLTDLVMPGMSGRTLLDWAREHQPEMRLLLMSGYVPAGARFVQGEGRSGVIDKPFAREDLLRKVEELLAA